MPAEWEPHEATWIAWPHNRDDWPGRFTPIPWVYGEIVRKLAAPYGVTVQSTAGDGRQIPQFNINLGETVWEIIDRITRYSQMIVYDMPDGSLMLAEVGKEAMASGFKIGVNSKPAPVADGVQLGIMMPLGM